MKNKKDICKKTEIRMLCRQFVRSGEIIGERKQRRRRRQQERQKSREWVSIGITTTLYVDHAMAICTFLCRHCTTTTWNVLFSRFIEDVNTKKGCQIHYLIITFTFCTNIFRLSGRKVLQEFPEHFASQTAIKRPHRKYRLGNFFLPVNKFKFYFGTKTPVF